MELGEFAVVVKNVPTFLARARAAAKEAGYRFARGLVQYYDPNIFHGSFLDVESVFRKQAYYRHQREFRLVMYAGPSRGAPLWMHLGDLSDITLVLPSADLNGPKFLGGDLEVRI